MDLKKLNIIFLASWYPNKLKPKNGNFIQQHARSVAAYANISAIHIIAANQDKTFVLEQQIVNNVNEVIVYYKKINSNSPMSQFKKLKRRRAAHLLAFNEIKKQINTIDLVHLNVTYPAGIFALHLKRKFNIPYIITEHWTGFLSISNHRFSAIEKYFIKKITANASLICPVSKNLQSNMERFGVQNKFEVIPNVVNTANFKIDQNKTYNKECLRILHLSHLKDDHKNISGILNTIKSLSNNRTDFKLTIAGDGDVEIYKEKAKALNIPEGVLQLETEKTTEEVAQLMNKNDVFLLFSNYENLPVVISEALIMGLPVVSSNVGGIDEMIVSSNGILVKAKDEKALETALNSMITNYSNYNIANLSIGAIEKYGINKVGKQLNNAYHSVLLE